MARGSIRLRLNFEQDLISDVLHDFTRQIM